MQRLGSKLRELRKQKGYTLRELGEKLNMSFSILAMYEREERTPPLDKLVLLAEFFNVSIDYLLGTEFQEMQREINRVKENKLGKIMKNPVYYNILKSGMEVAEEEIGSKIAEDGYFYYRVRDDSMSGSRICAGDLVLIQKTASAEEGSIVLVTTAYNEELIRRVFFQRKQVILEPDNNAYKPIILAEKELTVIGKVVRVEFDL